MPLNDYIQLKYIESSGTQYINTGWSKPSGDEGSIIHMDFEFIGSSSSLQGLFGCNHGSTYQLRQYIGATSDYKWYLRWRNNESTSQDTWDLNTRYNLEAKLRRGDSYIKIDGNYVIQGGETANYYSLPMYLFAINNNGTAENFSKIRLYSASLYQDSTLVREYIPVKRRSDNVAGLYDELNDVFYPSNGTAGFIAGPVKGDYTFLEYIESTGTQYIDTGVPIGNRDIKVIADFQYTNLPSSNQRLFGARTSDYTCFYLFGPDGSNQWKGQIGAGGSEQYINGKDTNRHIVTLDNSTGLYQIDETAITLSTTNYDLTYSLYIFCQNNAGNPQDYSQSKIYGFKIYKSNTLIRYFMPAMRNSDGAIGLYDKANDVFYTNKGTGEFIAGPDKTGYGIIEYIESNGTQILDTQLRLNTILTANSNWSVEVKMAVDQSSVDSTDTSTIFGSYSRVENSGGTSSEAYLIWLGYYNSKSASNLSCAFTNNTGLSGAIATSFVYDSNTHVYKFVRNNDANTGGFFMDSQRNSTGYSSSVMNNHPSLGIFGYYNNGTNSSTGRAYNPTRYAPTAMISAKLYELKIIVDGVTVCYALPAIDYDTNKIGMYDIVRNILLTSDLPENQEGTGRTIVKYDGTNYNPDQFIPGPEITPEISYEFLDSIKSTGTQYIDTGIPVNTIGGIDITFINDTNTMDYARVCGSNVRGFDFNMAGNSPSAGKSLTTYACEFSSIWGLDGFKSGENTFVTDPVSGNIIINGDSSLGAVFKPTSTTSNLWLLRGIDRYSLMTIKYVKIYDLNKNVMAELIPCRRMPDNTIGIYDKVNDVFYDNAGTGQFIPGNKLTGYTELSYIESNGTQIIDTGIKLQEYRSGSNSDFEVIATMSFVGDTTPSSRSDLFGVASRHSNGAAYLSHGANGSDSDTGKRTKLLYFGNGSTTYQSFDSGVAYSETIHTFSMKRRGSDTTNAGYRIDDSNFKQYPMNVTGENWSPVTIFGSYWKPSSTTSLPYTPYYLSSARLYKFEIYGGDTLVAHLKPAMRNEDGKVGLYDEVRNIFITSLIGDELIAGPEYTDTEYLFLDYIESTGTQYINTGLKGNLNTKFVAKINKVTPSTNNTVSIFGDNTTSNAYISLNTSTGSTARTVRFGNKSFDKANVMSINTDYVISFDKTGLYVDGNLVNSLDATNTFTTKNNLLLCRIVNVDPATYSNGITRYYYAQIYDGDTLVRDLVPARRSLDGAIGFYDKANDVFYPNLGSEPFIEGSATPFEFSYTGGIQEWEVPVTGTYKLETWGAQGGGAGGGSGSGRHTADGGYGGYSVGYRRLYKGDILYIAVGGHGTESWGTGGTGGYNGGGKGASYIDSDKDHHGAGGGGGATHIAAMTGTLSEIGESNLNRILIIAGGGGGAGYGQTGATGGGLSGGNGTWLGGTQAEGYSFGVGQNGNTYSNAGGGGGGLYGGRSGSNSSPSGGAAGGGSGYVGNLITPTTTNGVNSGDGKAKITFIEGFVVGVIISPDNIPCEIRGIGEYLSGETANLRFISLDGKWKVENWIKGGEVVANTNRYSFIVTGDTSLSINAEEFINSIIL